MTLTTLNPSAISEARPNGGNLIQNVQRHSYLDFIKGIAIFFVIETHAREMAGTNFYDFILNTIFYSIDRNGVLLFFLCSGALLLSRNSLDIASTIKRCIRLIVILTIYSIITNSVFYIIHGKDVLLEIKDALMFNNMLTSFNYDKAIHLWFLCAYIPLLLVSPIIGFLVRNVTEKKLILLISVLIICGPLSKVMIVLGLPYFELLDAGDKATFLTYMVVGYAIHNNKLWVCRITPYLALLIAIFSIFLNIACQNFISASNLFHSDEWEVFNDYSSSLFLLPSSVFLFIFFKNIKIKSNLIEKIGKQSFGIYLNHYIIMICFFKVIPELSSPFDKYMIAIVIALIGLPLSMMVSGLMIRLKLSYLVR